MTVHAVPKPVHRPAKRRAPVKRRNTKRYDREWARAYHSSERVVFLKGMACVACLLFGGIECAHIEGGGAGRRADYTRTIPLCRTCHRSWHRQGDDFLRVWNLTREDLEIEAEMTEKRWLRHAA